MKKNITYIIDFDSTITQVEALDELVSIVLKYSPNKKDIEQQIVSITNEAMNGKLPFDKALTQRLALLPIEKKHIHELIEILKTKISISFLNHQDILKKNAENILVISGGFKEFIVPIIQSLGLLEHKVYANTFLFNEKDVVIGYDTNNLLSQAKGKVKLVESLHLTNEVIVIGDGYTDYEIKEANLAAAFYLFTENISRTHLISKADKVICSFDELLVD